VGVHKSDEGETVVCWLCHKEGHKSYQCRLKTERDNKKKPTSKISNTYTNKVDKKAATPYLIKKNKKVIVIKANKQANKEKRPNKFGFLRILFQL
jgi:GH18 family chitinase